MREKVCDWKERERESVCVWLEGERVRVKVGARNMCDEWQIIEWIDENIDSILCKFYIYPNKLFYLQYQNYLGSKSIYFNNKNLLMCYNLEIIWKTI